MCTAYFQYIFQNWVISYCITSGASTQMACKNMTSHHRLFLSPHRLKSKSGIETLPSSSGAFLCLLESGEPLAFSFSTPNRVRLSMDSNGRTATAMGKLILGETRTVLAAWKDSTSSMLLWLLGKSQRGEERGQGNSQFIPFDVVEEAFVCAHSLGLDRFKQVLAIVGEGTHQEVLLITATKQHNKYFYCAHRSLGTHTVCGCDWSEALSDIYTASRFDKNPYNKFLKSKNLTYACYVNAHWLLG